MTVTCSSSQLLILGKEYKSPLVFAKFYLSSTQSLSPVPGLSVKTVTQLSNCLAKHQTSSAVKIKTSSVKKTTTSSKKKHKKDNNDQHQKDSDDNYQKDYDYQLEEAHYYQYGKCEDGNNFEREYCKKGTSLKLDKHDYTFDKLPVIHDNQRQYAK
ncbi:hypothetical protein MBLNU459_g7849t1 [Dothideomycetes sp. NU459]